MKKMRMNRREMLAGLAVGGCGLREQGQVEIDPSLYIPKAHLVEDRKLLHDFMDQYPFVDLVTPWPTLRITHLPVVLDRTAGAYGRILGHISRQNLQIQS